MANPEDYKGIVKRYLIFIEKFARFLGKLGVTPQSLTLAGLFLALVAGVFFWTGHLVIGGIFLFISGISDSLDGALARTYNKETKFGAVLDSTLDRYAEFAIYLGFYGYLGHSFSNFVTLFQVVAIFALVGSVMVSYIRARSEGIGIPCSVGFWQRPERIVALGVGALLTGAINPLLDKISYNYLHDFFIRIILVVLAVGTNLTALKRLFFVKKSLRIRGMK